MPEATTFRISTYRKLAKGELGLTQAASNRVAASEALAWVLNELPDDAWTVTHDDSGDVATIVIDWSQVPDSIRHPKITAGRR
jgi:hypothetical protein